MNKTVRLFALGFSVLLAGAARAGVLYWQVSQEATAEIGAYNLVVLKYAESTGSGDNLEGTALTSSAVVFEGGKATPGYTGEKIGYWNGADYTLIAQTDLGAAGVAGNSFFVELLLGSGEDLSSAVAVGRSNAISYESLSSYIDTPTDFNTVNAWSPAFHAVPEPTSGMLLMMGFGLLGLRRKRRQV